MLSVSSNQKNQRGGACGTYGGKRGAFRILVEESEGKKHKEKLRVGEKVKLK